LLSNETALDLDLFRTINRSVSLIKKERLQSIVRCVKKADVVVFTFFLHKTYTKTLKISEVTVYTKLHQDVLRSFTYSSKDKM